MERPLNLRDRAAWRAWLEAHHATETEAVVALSKVSVAGGLHYLEALEEALCFGWIDGRLRAHDAATFSLRFTPRRPDSVWSEANRERVGRLIRGGRMAPAGLARVEEAMRRGTWAAATRTSRVPRMPRDLREALRAVPGAWSNFSAWGASFRSACVRWVLDSKRVETRERRVRRVVERARDNRRPGIEGF